MCLRELYLILIIYLLYTFIYIYVMYNFILLTIYFICLLLINFNLYSILYLARMPKAVDIHRVHVLFAFVHRVNLFKIFER